MTLKRVLLAVLAGAVVMFVWGAASHLLLFKGTGFSRLPNQDRVLAELRAMDGDEWLANISDPRGIHRTLYGSLTPDGYPEYAGNYRGSLPSLQRREVGVNPEIEKLVGASKPFMPSAQVEAGMCAMAGLVSVKAMGLASQGCGR